MRPESIKQINGWPACDRGSHGEDENTDQEEPDAGRNHKAKPQPQRLEAITPKASAIQNGYQIEEFRAPSTRPRCHERAREGLPMMQGQASRMPFFRAASSKTCDSLPCNAPARQVPAQSLCQKRRSYLLWTLAQFLLLCFACSDP